MSISGTKINTEITISDSAERIIKFTANLTEEQTKEFYDILSQQIKETYEKAHAIWGKAFEERFIKHFNKP